jgi:hypothetical protein
VNPITPPHLDDEERLQWEHADGLTRSLLRRISIARAETIEARQPSYAEMQYAKICGLLRIPLQPADPLFATEAADIVYRMVKDRGSRAAYSSGFHNNHGKATEEDGPEDLDCPCRGSPAAIDCADEGCGFCSAEVRGKG